MANAETATFCVRGSRSCHCFQTSGPYIDVLRTPIQVDCINAFPKIWSGVLNPPTISQSIGNPSLSFHLVSKVLLGIPNGSTTLCATSTPATGKPLGSRSPSCKTGVVSLPGGRRNRIPRTCTRTEAWSQYLCAAIRMDIVVVAVHIQAYMCLCDRVWCRCFRGPHPSREESLLEGQLVSSERNHADESYFQRLARRFDARQEVVNFLREAYSVEHVSGRGHEGVLRTVV